jgi:hypothetical protein
LQPKSISSSTVLIREFLKHWGPRTHKFEDVVQDLEDAFLGQCLPSYLIEGLRETLLLKYDENTIREQEDDSNEESFECLKENIEEDNEFCEQLLEHCDKDFLVRFCIQRKEEYDTILWNYEKKPTQNATWEVYIAYYRVKSLCDAVTKKYGH